LWQKGDIGGDRDKGRERRTKRKGMRKRDGLEGNSKLVVWG